MSDSTGIDLVNGIAREHYQAAAQLYDEAFGPKFQTAIKSREHRLALFERTFDGDYAIGAIENGELVGLAGYQTMQGSLTSGINLHQLISTLGLARALWAIVIFSLYERSPKSNELVMDGIAVRADQRGKGIGGLLLTEIINYANGNGYSTVRLDVINTNPGAQRLYERNDFVPRKTERFPHLRWLLGFSGSTTMIREL